MAREDRRRLGATQVAVPGTCFPQVANTAEVRNTGGALGGTLQPLQLDVTDAFELARET